MHQPGTCVHFTGIQHKTCEAGIKYLVVRDSSQPGPFRWPCVTIKGRDPATTSCASYQEPTPKQIADDEAAFKSIAAEFLARTTRGDCNACGAKVVAVHQVGHCVYAAPCGHRQGQGDAKEMSKMMGLPVVP